LLPAGEAVAGWVYLPLRERTFHGAREVRLADAYPSMSHAMNLGGGQDDWPRGTRYAASKVSMGTGLPYR
jgi:hypothetical protein